MYCKYKTFDSEKNNLLSPYIQYLLSRMSRPRYLRAILVYSCIKEGLLYYGDVESILMYLVVWTVL